MEVRWFTFEEKEPPSRVLIMVCGPSGYSIHKKYIELVYHDEAFRPSLEGKKRWITPAGDSVTDTWPYPTHWAYPINLPE